MSTDEGELVCTVSPLELQGDIEGNCEQCANRHYIKSIKVQYMCKCTYINARLCTYMYVYMYAYSFIPVAPLELQGDLEGWSEQTQHKVFSHKFFDLFTCNSENQINIYRWLAGFFPAKLSL